MWSLLGKCFMMGFGVTLGFVIALIVCAVISLLVDKDGGKK